MINTLFLEIRKRSGLVYKGYVRSVSSKNIKGKFDILPGHANFITLAVDSINILTDEGRRESIYNENALLKIENNKIEIFMDIASFEEDNVDKTDN